MTAHSDYPDLSAREREVLGYIIQNFITTATPVASQSLVQRHRLPVSPATVRSAMNSLESKGLLNHPHTSAGRVPTDLGYRFYAHHLHDFYNCDWIIGQPGAVRSTPPQPSSPSPPPAHRFL